MRPHPASCHFIPLRPKYSPQHRVFNTFNLCASLNVRNQVSYPYKTVKHFGDISDPQGGDYVDDFWNVAPCGLTETNRRFRGANCL
jgi:hypothetical protein